MRVVFHEKGVMATTLKVGTVVVVDILPWIMAFLVDKTEVVEEIKVTTKVELRRKVGHKMIFRHLYSIPGNQGIAFTQMLILEVV